MSVLLGSEWLVWAGIAFCLSQSAMFSGLNLALFGISRLRLEVEVASGNKAAMRILHLRQDSNFLLTTILWGNVSINVLLALLSNSVLAGVSAFLFSTVLITFFGEIGPQAYFSRNALQTGSLFAPLLRFYQLILYPVAKPTAMVLDWLLGKEGITYFREQDIRALIQKHIEADNSDITRLEGTGAMNFLALDDLAVTQEGEPLDPLSVVAVPHQDGKPIFPDFEHSRDDPFIRAVNASGKKWVIIADTAGEPSLVMNASNFLRTLMFADEPVDVHSFCQQPAVVRDTRVLLGSVLSHLIATGKRKAGEAIAHGPVLIWA